MLRDSTPRFVGPSVRPSIGPSIRPSICPSHFTFLAFMGFLAIPLLPKCSTDLKYGPCPPARDWGSRVSGLVFCFLFFLFFFASLYLLHLCVTQHKPGRRVKPYKTLRWRGLGTATNDSSGRSCGRDSRSGHSSGVIRRRRIQKEKEEEVLEVCVA